jgi:hypothetical protein
MQWHGLVSDGGTQESVMGVETVMRVRVARRGAAAHTARARAALTSLSRTE